MSQIVSDTTSDGQADFEAIRRRAPKAVRAAIDDFLLGVTVDSQSDHKIIVDWRNRLAFEFKDISFEEAKSNTDALAAIEQLKKEFIVLVSQKKQYGALLRFWGWTAVLCLVVQILLGEGGILSLCIETIKQETEKGQTVKDDKKILKMLCNPIHGHFCSYISFRYAMYGVLLGNALIFSYRRSAPRFDTRYYFNQSLLKRPILNLIVGSVLTYILSRLVAEGSLSVNIIGLEIARTVDPPDKFHFRNSGALFILGLAAGMAADVFLQRLVNRARKSAESVFGNTTKL